MATTLGSLILELGLDDKKFNDQLRDAKTTALKAGQAIENNLKGIDKSKLDLHLEPTVNDEALTALNKHLELKRKHFQSVQGYFRQNPLTVKADSSDLDLATDKFDILQRRKLEKKELEYSDGRIVIDQRDLDEALEKIKLLNHELDSLSRGATISTRVAQEVVAPPESEVRQVIRTENKKSPYRQVPDPWMDEPKSNRDKFGSDSLISPEDRLDYDKLADAVERGTAQGNRNFKRTDEALTNTQPTPESIKYKVSQFKQSAINDSSIGVGDIHKQLTVMTKHQLTQIAKLSELKGYSKLNKAELVNLLSNPQNAASTAQSAGILGYVGDRTVSAVLEKTVGKFIDTAVDEGLIFVLRKSTDLLRAGIRSIPALKFLGIDKVLSREITSGYQKTAPTVDKTFSEKGKRRGGFGGLIGEVKNLATVPARIITKPARDAIQGFFEGVGNAYGDAFAGGAMIAQEKKTGKSVTDVGEAVAGTTIGGILSGTNAVDNVVNRLGAVSRIEEGVKPVMEAYGFGGGDGKGLDVKVLDQIADFTTRLGNIVGKSIDPDKAKADVESIKTSLFELGKAIVTLDNIAGKGLSAVTTVQQAAQYPKQAVVDQYKKTAKESAFDMDARMTTSATAPKELKEGTKRVMFVSAGFAGKQGMQGHTIADIIKPMVPETTEVIPFENREFDVNAQEVGPDSSVTDLAQWGSEVMANFLKILELGYNPSAVRMAQEAYAYSQQNPGVGIDLVGHSAGGMIAREAQAILSQVGVESNVLSVATPLVGLVEPQTANAVSIMGEGDPLVPISPNQKITEGVEGHAFRVYAANENVSSMIETFSRTGVSPELIQQLEDTQVKATEGGIKLNNAVEQLVDNLAETVLNSAGYLAPKQAKEKIQARIKSVSAQLKADADAGLINYQADVARKGFRTSEVIGNPNHPLTNRPLNRAQTQLSDEEAEQITLFVGGLGGSLGLESEQMGTELSAMLPDHLVVAVETPENEVLPAEGETVASLSFLQKAIGVIAKDLNFEGDSAAAERLAERAYMYHLQNPDKPINLVGQSGGGMLTRHAADILNQMGVPDVRVANTATPSFGSAETQGITLVSPDDPLARNAGAIMPNQVRVDSAGHSLYFANRTDEPNTIENFNRRLAGESQVEVNESTQAVLQSYFDRSLTEEQARQRVVGNSRPLVDPPKPIAEQVADVQASVEQKAQEALALPGIKVAEAQAAIADLTSQLTLSEQDWQKLNDAITPLTQKMKELEAFYDRMMHGDATSQVEAAPAQAPRPPPAPKQEVPQNVPEVDLSSLPIEKSRKIMAAKAASMMEETEASLKTFNPDGFGNASDIARYQLTQAKKALDSIKNIDLASDLSEADGAKVRKAVAPMQAFLKRAGKDLGPDTNQLAAMSEEELTRFIEETAYNIPEVDPEALKRQLASLTKAQLTTVAKKSRKKGYSKLNKAQLIEFLGTGDNRELGKVQGYAQEQELLTQFKQAEAHARAAFNDADPPSQENYTKIREEIYDLINTINIAMETQLRSGDVRQNVGGIKGRLEQLVNQTLKSVNPTDIDATRQRLANSVDISEPQVDQTGDETAEKRSGLDDVGGLARVNPKKILGDLHSSLRNLIDPAKVIPRKYKESVVKSAQVLPSTELDPRHLNEAYNQIPETAKQVVFVSVGFTGTKGQQANVVAENIKPFAPEGSHLVPFHNATFDVSPNAGPLTWVKDALTTTGGAVTAGGNEDALQLAKQVFDLKQANPDMDVKLMGHSAGGLIIREAQEILKGMGIFVEALSIGTPLLGVFKAIKSDAIALMGEHDELKAISGQREAIVPGVQGHESKYYTESESVQQLISSYLKNGITPELIEDTRNLGSSPLNNIDGLARIDPKKFISDTIQKAKTVLSKPENITPSLERNVNRVAKTLEERLLLAGFRVGDGVVAALDSPTVEAKLTSFLGAVKFDDIDQGMSDLGDELNVIARQFIDNIVNGLPDGDVIDSTSNVDGFNTTKTVTSKITSKLGGKLAEGISELSASEKEKLTSVMGELKSGNLDSLPDKLQSEIALIIKKLKDKLMEGFNELELPELDFLDETLRNNRVVGLKRRGIPLANERAKEILDGKKSDEYKSDRKGNNAHIVDESTRELIIATGGYAKARGLSGKRLKTQLDKTVAEDQKVIWVQNKDSDIPKTDGASEKMQALMVSLGKPHARGFSPDAVEMAAQAIAALEINPEITIKLLGESGGGNVAEEAYEIVKGSGYTNVEYIGVGTPDFVGGFNKNDNSKIISPDEYLGSETAKLYQNLGLAKNKETQNILGVKDHPFENYAEAKIAEVENFIHGTPEPVDNKGSVDILNAAKMFDSQDFDSLDERQLTNIAKMAFANLQMVRRQLAVATEETEADLRESAKIFESVYIKASPEGRGMSQVKGAIKKAQELLLQLQNEPTENAQIIASQVIDELKIYQKEFRAIYADSTGTTKIKFKDIDNNLNDIILDFQKIQSGGVDNSTEEHSEPRNDVTGMFSGFDINTGNIIKIFQDELSKSLELMKEVTLNKIKTLFEELRSQVTQAFGGGEEFNLDQGLARVSDKKNPLALAKEKLAEYQRKFETATTLVFNNASQTASDLDNSFIGQGVRDEVGNLVERGQVAATGKGRLDDAKFAPARDAENQNGLFQRTKRTFSGLKSSFTNLFSGSQAAMEAATDEIYKVQRVYDAIAKEVAAVSGVELEEVDIPKLIVDDQMLGDIGADAFYDIQRNQVIISSETQKLLANAENLGDYSEHLKDVIHELRHATQLEFGKRSLAQISSGQQTFATSYMGRVDNPEQLASVQASIDVVQERAGYELSDADVDTIRRAEEDAYSFEANSGAILEKVGKTTIKDSEAKIQAATSALRSGMTELLATADNVFPGISDGVYGALDAFEKFGAAGSLAVQAFISWKVLSWIVPQLASLASVSLDTARVFEQLNVAMGSALGGSNAAATGFAFVRSEVDRLNTDLISATKSYIGLSSSTQGTELQGEATNQIFSATQQAISANQLDPQEAERVGMAIQQIASKGVVSSEELRQQLSESLPGAFQIAARSMGMTVVEFNKMLETGSLLSEDFLPRFAQQLSAETANGVVGAANSAQGAMNRFNNEMLSTQAALGTPLLTPQKMGLNLLSDALNVVQENGALVTQVLTVTLTVFAGAFAQAIYAAAAATLSWLAAAGLIPAALGTIKGAISLLIGQLAVLMKHFLLLYAVTEVIEIFGKAWNSGKNEIYDFARTAEKSMDTYIDALERARSANESFVESLPENRKDVKGASFLEDFIIGDAIKFVLPDEMDDQVNNGFRAFENFIVKNSGLAASLNFARTGEFRGVTRAEATATQEASNRGEFLTAANATVTEAYNQIGLDGKGANELAKVRDIDTQLEDIQARRRGLMPQDTEARKQLDAEIDTLRVEREKASKPIGILQQKLASEGQALQQLLVELDEKAASGSISRGDYESQYLATQNAIEANITAQEKLNSLIRQSVDRVQLLAWAFEDVNTAIAESTYSMEMQVAQQNRALATATLQRGTLNTGATEGTAAIVMQEQLAMRIENNRNSAALLMSELTGGEVSRALTLSGIQEDGDITKVSPEFLTSRANRMGEGPEKQILLDAAEQYTQVRDMALESENLLTQIEESKVQLQTQIDQMGLELERMFEDIEIQTKEIELATKQLVNDRNFANASAMITRSMSRFRGNYFSGFMDGLSEFVDVLNREMQQTTEYLKEKLAIMQQALQNTRQTTDLANQVPGVDGSVTGGGQPGQGSSLGGSKGAGTLVGIVGNTGVGTGAHLDIRYSREYANSSGRVTADGNRARVADEHLARIAAGGTPLTELDNKITSEHGWRNHPVSGGRRHHDGVDYGLAAGTRLTSTVAIESVSQPTWDAGGGGWVTKVRFSDGVELMLLHQDPSSQNAGIGTGGQPVQQTAQPQGGGRSTGGASTGRATGVSRNIIDHFREFEGLRTQAYLDPVGVPTIGLGNTRMGADGRGRAVRLGDTITEEQAVEMASGYLDKVSAEINRLVKVPLNQGQFDALASWLYNVGEGALETSTLLDKLNAGDYQGAANELLRWNKAGNQVLPGLTRRREAERQMFLNGGSGGGGSAAPPQNSEFERYMREGYALTERKDYQSALINFRRAAELQPDNRYATQAIQNVTGYINRARPASSSAMSAREGSQTTTPSLPGAMTGGGGSSSQQPAYSAADVSQLTQQTAVLQGQVSGIAQQQTANTNQLITNLEERRELERFINDTQIQSIFQKISNNLLQTQRDSAIRSEVTMPRQQAQQRFDAIDQPTETQRLENQLQMNEFDTQEQKITLEYDLREIENDIAEAEALRLTMPTMMENLNASDEEIATMDQLLVGFIEASKSLVPGIQEALNNVETHGTAMAEKFRAESQRAQEEFSRTRLEMATQDDVTLMREQATQAELDNRPQEAQDLNYRADNLETIVNARLERERFLVEFEEGRFGDKTSPDVIAFRDERLRDIDARTEVAIANIQKLSEQSIVELEQYIKNASSESSREVRALEIQTLRFNGDPMQALQMEQQDALEAQLQGFEDRRIAIMFDPKLDGPAEEQLLADLEKIREQTIEMSAQLMVRAQVQLEIDNDAAVLEGEAANLQALIPNLLADYSQGEARDMQARLDGLNIELELRQRLQEITNPENGLTAENREYLTQLAEETAELKKQNLERDLILQKRRDEIEIARNTITNPGGPQALAQVQDEYLGMYGITPTWQMKQERLPMQMEMQNLNYQQQLIDLEELRNSGKLTQEAFEKAKVSLEAMNNIKLDQLKVEASGIPEIVNAVKSPIKSFFTDLLDPNSTKTFGEAFSDMINGMLANLASLAADWVTNSLFSSFLGGGAGSPGKEGGLFSSLFGGGQKEEENPVAAVLGGGVPTSGSDIEGAMGLADSLWPAEGGDPGMALSMGAQEAGMAMSMGGQEAANMLIQAGIQFAQSVQSSAMSASMGSSGGYNWGGMAGVTRPTGWLDGMTAFSTPSVRSGGGLPGFDMNNLNFSFNRGAQTIGQSIIQSSSQGANTFGGGIASALQGATRNVGSIFGGGGGSKGKSGGGGGFLSGLFGVGGGGGGFLGSLLSIGMSFLGGFNTGGPVTKDRAITIPNFAKGGKLGGIADSAIAEAFKRERPYGKPRLIMAHENEWILNDKQQKIAMSMGVTPSVLNFAGGGIVGSRSMPTPTVNTSNIGGASSNVSVPITINSSGGNEEEDTKLAQKLKGPIEGLVRGIINRENRFGGSMSR